MRTFYKSIVINCILAILIIAAPASAEQGKFYRTFFQSGDIPSIDQALVGDQIGIQLVDKPYIQGLEPAGVTAYR